MTAISRVFFPPKPLEAKEITFKTAVEAVNTQRIARITKAALFALSSVATTVTLVLTEASIISWTLAIPVILVTILTGIIFFRLNALDKRYLEGLDDTIRSSLAKKELERILLSSIPLKSEEVTKSLKDINRLLGSEIFEKDAIAHILLMQSKAALNQPLKSIAEFAFEQNKPIIISANSAWLEQGRYGLPSFELSVGVNWSGNPTDSLEVNYTRTNPTPKKN